MNIRSFFEEITAVVGSGGAALSLDGIDRLPVAWLTKPVGVVRPMSSHQVAEIVRIAERERVSLIARGGGTRLDCGYGPNPDRPYLILDTSRMNQIIDHQPEDLTVTCEAGVTLRDLQIRLGQFRQRLALDVPMDHLSTVGGIVSSNAFGFERAAYGTPRDLVIGLRVVMSQGVEVKGGGKVVKNVAGYDLCKLFTGAWGTLGIVTEVTFKVRAVAEDSRMLSWRAADLPRAAEVGFALNQARLAGTAFMATDEIDGTPRLVVGVQGGRARTDWQATEYSRMAADAGLSTESRANSEPSFDMVAEEQVCSWRDAQARLSLQVLAAGRVSCLPTEVRAVTALLAALPAAGITADCASGTISFALPEQAMVLALGLRSKLPPGSHLVWTRFDRSDAGAGALDRWGSSGDAASLNSAIKRALDPADTFGSGRFLQPAG